MHVALALLAALQLAAATPADTVVVGTYRNIDYGFSVTLPNGVQGTMSAAPAPNHGFIVSVPGTVGATVSVTAYYNATLSSGLRDAAAEFVAPVPLEDPRLKRARAQLGGLTALRLVFTQGGAAESKREVIMALRKQKGPVGILYTLELTASPNDFERARAVLSALQASFRLHSIE
jgi:hypothetical protein